MTLTVGSLFSGIGGLDLGLERAGMQIRFQVELDPYCNRVLARHWPDVPRFGDVREVGAHNLPPVDLLCGGFPCQPHSLAGKRLASDDERDLWGEFARLIRELRPRWVLVENVPGILSSETGRFFGRVLADLAGLGFDVEWESLPAAAFGAPHIRERVFIVAQSASLGWRKGRAGRPAGGAEGLPIQPHQPAVLADPTSLRREGDQQLVAGERVGPNQEGPYITQSTWWAAEPGVDRVVDGLSPEVDRLRALGNAVVPQVAEWLGWRILTVAAL